MVRFGNVLGSTGSVIPKFREQIAGGGPVTVTHADITRYFMSIPEAAQLVLQAGLMGKGGEIFVLDMGEPVKIVDLARDMIRLSGYSEVDIEIKFTGLRRGEKLFEELLATNEHTLATGHPKVRVVRALAAPDPSWLRETMAWLDAPDALDDHAVRGQLARLVPEYRPAESR
jgi:FlaA1/EpsC-like NDP-sugar epimerase